MIRQTQRLQATATCPTCYATGLPIIGTVDTANPVIWFFGAAFTAALLLPKTATGKTVATVGALGAYYWASKISL